MTDSPWQGDGPDYSTTVGGRCWTLHLAQPQPGLAWSDGRSMARLLTLLHVSTGERRDDQAFDGTSLLSFERHRRRIQALYAPGSWPGLSIRAAWEPTLTKDGMDLEIQVSASSPGVCPRLRVGIGSRWIEGNGPTPPEQSCRVETRRAGADRQFPPHACRVSGMEPGRAYLEMVQPNDCARRVVGESRPDSVGAGAFRLEHELFGYDLEKGVVLRGRIRGIWIDPHSIDDLIQRRYEDFLDEPPPLGP